MPWLTLEPGAVLPGKARVADLSPRCPPTTAGRRPLGPPALIPVRRRDLAVLAAGLAVATWLLVRAFYQQLPPLDWWLPAPLAVLAVAEALGARTLRSRLADLREARAARDRADVRPPTKLVRPVEPLMVARLAVLAQASAYVGAVFAGIWIGVLLHVAPAVHRLQPPARTRSRRARRRRVRGTGGCRPLAGVGLPRATGGPRPHPGRLGLTPGGVLLTVLPPSPARAAGEDPLTPGT